MRKQTLLPGALASALQSPLPDMAIAQEELESAPR